MSLPSTSPLPPAGLAPFDLLVCPVGPAADRARIASALEAEGSRIMAGVRSAADLACACAAGAPHVVVLSESALPGNLPGPIRRVARILPRSRIVACLRRPGATDTRAALSAGAVGIVRADRLVLTLPIAVRTVAAGHTALPGGPPGAEGVSLSAREAEILALVARGHTDAHIAARLYLARSTVRSHLSTGFAKLGIRSRHQVAAALTGVRAVHHPPPASRRGPQRPTSQEVSA
jgi:DNA-binding NarL/FixJ family response regulator